MFITVTQKPFIINTLSGLNLQFLFVDFHSKLRVKKRTNSDRFFILKNKRDGEETIVYLY